jgi:hypothetical protein
MNHTTGPVLSDRIAGLRRLERLQYEHLLNEKRKEFDEKKVQLHVERHTKPRQDASTVQLIIDAWQDFRTAVVTGLIDIRRKLAEREPALASAEELSLLRTNIEGFVMTHSDRLYTIQQFAEPYKLLEPVLAAMAERSKPRDYDILETATNRLEQLQLEFKHDLYKAPEANVKTTIYQFNLGNIHGVALPASSREPPPSAITPSQPCSQ